MCEIYIMRYACGCKGRNEVKETSDTTFAIGKGQLRLMRANAPGVQESGSFPVHICAKTACMLAEL